MSNSRKLQPFYCVWDNERNVPISKHISLFDATRELESLISEIYTIPHKTIRECDNVLIGDRIYYRWLPSILIEYWTEKELVAYFAELSKKYTNQY